MKHLFTLSWLLLLSYWVHAQPGTNCNNAVTQNPDVVCTPVTHQFATNEDRLWIQLDADFTETKSVKMQWDNTNAQIEQIKVYQNTAGCLNLIATNSIHLNFHLSNVFHFITLQNESYLVEIIRSGQDTLSKDVDVCLEKSVWYIFDYGLCWQSDVSSGVSDFYDSLGYEIQSGPQFFYNAPDSTGDVDDWGYRVNLCVGDTICVHGVSENFTNNWTPDCADLSYAGDIWWYVPGSNYANNLPVGEELVYYPTTTNQLCLTYDSAGVFPIGYYADSADHFNYLFWADVPTGFYVEVADTTPLNPDFYIEDTICVQLGQLENEAEFIISNLFDPLYTGTYTSIQLYLPFMSVYLDGQFVSSGQGTNGFYYSGTGVNLMTNFDFVDSLNSIINTYGTHTITFEIVPQNSCQSAASFTHTFEVLDPYLFELEQTCNEITVRNVGCGTIPFNGVNFTVAWGDGNFTNVTSSDHTIHYYTTPGTYEVIVQGVGEQQPDTLVVVIPAVPTTVPVFGNNRPCCLDDLVYSTLGGYVSYDWIVVGGTPNATNLNPIYVDWNSPFSGGHVNVTATDSNGCQSTGSLYVDTCMFTAGTPPDIWGPDMKCCTTANVYSINGNYSGFNWTVNDGVIVANNGSSITVNWNSPNSSTYITVSMLDGRCQPVTATLLVEACCKPNVPVGYDLNFITDYCAPSLISNVLSGASSYTSGNAILINNDLIIDQDFTFTACPHIYVMEGAKIYVQPGVRFMLNNDCVIRPMCDQPWKGIHVDDPSSIVVISRSTVIGAEIALLCEKDARYEINASKFYNNDIGIKVRDFITISPNFIHTSQIGTSSTEPDVFGNRPSYGMKIEEVQHLTIGEGNQFFSMDFGIHITNSNVTCLKNAFYNFIANVGGFQEGIAIYANTDKGSSGNLLIAGTSNSDKNIFNTCDVGIFAQNKMSLQARSNQMTSIGTVGIIARRSVGTQIEIERNDIKLTPGFALGIYLWGMTNVTAEVNYNRINLMTLNNVGALVAGIAFDQVDVSVINNVNCTYNLVRQCSYGVYANITPQINIAYNTLQFQNNGLYNNLVYGVYASGCTGANIEQNQITRMIGQPTASDPNDNLIGIHAENSPQVRIFNNTVNRFGRGIQASGNNANSEMYCNQMTRSFNGIYLNNASIGNQGGLISGTFYDQDNKWSQNIADKINGTGFNPPSNWYYRSGGTYNLNPFDPASGISDIVNNSASSFCPINPVRPGRPILPRPRSQERRAFFDPIVYDDMTYLTYDTTMKYLDNVYAMSTFYKDTTWLTVGDTSDVTYHQYFAQEDAGNLGKICRISDAYSVEDYTSLATYNNALNASQCHYTLGIKDVNTIFLDTWANDEFDFDATQQQRLEELACSEPLENGIAVYSARTLLGWFFQCNNGTAKMGLAPIQTNELTLENGTSFEVYPNPGEQEVYLMYDLGVNEQATMVVQDITGKVMCQIHLTNENGVAQIPAERLDSGLYLYTITSDSKAIGNGKFIIK